MDPWYNHRLLYHPNQSITMVVWSYTAYTSSNLSAFYLYHIICWNEIKWKLSIRRTLGSWKLPCYYTRNLTSPGHKNRRTKDLGPANLTVISGISVYWSSLYWVSSVSLKEKSKLKYGYNVHIWLHHQRATLVML